MGSDGIARTKVKPGSEVKIEDAKENSVIVNGLVSENNFPLIVDTTQIVSMTKEARDYFAIHKRDSKVIGIAIIRNSSLGNMVANFFIGLNKPTVPVKLFNHESDAIKWCDQFKF
jgi:hypothetical protein